MSVPAPQRLSRHLIPGEYTDETKVVWSTNFFICFSQTFLLNDYFQVTAEGGPGGVVSARDFVFVYRTGRREDGSFVQAGCSVDIPGAPKDKKIVRYFGGGEMFCCTPSYEKKVIFHSLWRFCFVVLSETQLLL